MKIHIAHSFWQRLRGLLAYTLWPDEALLLVPCKSIHTFGMGQAIDVAFIDRDGWVIASRSALPPRRRMACRGAAATLERISPRDGGASTRWFEVGERLEMGGRVP